jgi:hypothetical protein
MTNSGAIWSLAARGARKSSTQGKLYLNQVLAQELSVSMTETYHCPENALAERMNGIRKRGHGLGREFKTKVRARLGVDQMAITKGTLLQANPAQSICTRTHPPYAGSRVLVLVLVAAPRADDRG